VITCSLVAIGLLTDAAAVMVWRKFAFLALSQPLKGWISGVLFDRKSRRKRSRMIFCYLEH
jgi:hypothetical protein